MSTAIGVSLPRLATAVGKAVSEYAVLGKTPGFTADFIKNKYPSYSSFASAITHSRSGNAVMTDGYGPELVVNGGFDSGTDGWNTSGNVTVEDGVATLDGSSTTLLWQSILTIGKMYEVNFDVVSVGGGSLELIDNGGTAYDTFNTTGPKKLLIEASGSNSNLLWRTRNNAIASIDNVSVREMPVLKWAPHNLVTYSEEFDNAAWSKTRVTVTANNITAPDGSLTADKLVVDSNAGSHFARRNATTNTGDLLTLAVFAKAAEYDYIAVYAGTTGKGKYFDLSSGSILGDLIAAPNDARITDVGDGWYLCEIDVTTTGNEALSVYLSPNGSSYSFTGDGSSGVYLWGAHLYRSDLGGMVANPDQPPSRASYVPTTSSAVYLPRVGHHVYNGSAWVNEGLLAESEARTNLVVQSHDFNTSWSKINISLTSDDAVGPDGLESADLLVANTTNSQHRVDLTPTSSAGTQTFSVYVKAGGYSYVWLRIGLNGAGFDLTDASNFSISSGITPTVQDVGNGWYRCAISTTGATANDVLRINVTSTATLNDFAGDGTSGIYIYGAQLEQASTPSSLIPTSGSSVTRAAETFTIPSANLPWPNPVYIGSELVTNGDFSSTDISDWTTQGDANLTVTNGELVVSGNGGYNDLGYYILTTTANKIYAVTITGRSITGSIRVQARLADSPYTVLDSYTFSSTNAETVTLYFVAQASSTSLQVVQWSGSSGSGAVDNISVREINPLSVSIAMDGRVTYADEDTSQQHYLVNWFDDTSNMIRTWIDTTQGTGAFDFRQSEGGTTDIVTSGTDTLAPDILVPYSISQRHGSTFLNGALDGVSLTEDTTPTALPDLSATDLQFAYDYMGTISVFRVWDRDIGDTGLVEATNPSLEPSLSLTFEGTGTNSFIVNDWSE